MGPVNYLTHLQRESARFAQAIREAAPDAPVPSCPDWNADDLLWHLAEVQWFWATMVREGARRQRDLPHLLGLCARHRRPRRRVLVAGPDGAGPAGGVGRAEGTGAAAAGANPTFTD